MVLLYPQPTEEEVVIDGDVVTMNRSSQRTNDMPASRDLTYTFSKYNFSVELLFVFEKVGGVVELSGYETHFYLAVTNRRINYMYNIC